MRTSDAFYLKQLVFSFSAPFIVICVVIAWSTMYGIFGRRCKWSLKQLKNFIILSIVMSLFLAYPMLVKICLSMLKCVKVGEHRYLVADLQEPCFYGRHNNYVLAVFLPQFILHVIGLPAIAFWIVKRAKNKFVDVRGQKIAMYRAYDFRLRYGLLYMGYREDREWWEVVIAGRKVVIVAIGTFGTLLGLVDVQAFVALAAIFAAILIHLVGEPFDVEGEEVRVLHKLEFTALTLAWMTFWGGLFFYLGHDRPGAIRYLF